MSYLEQCTRKRKRHHESLIFLRMLMLQQKPATDAMAQATSLRGYVGVGDTTSCSAFAEHRHDR
jgi:hypothetical protein